MPSTIQKKLVTAIGICGAAVGFTALANQLMNRYAQSLAEAPTEELYYEWRYGKAYYTKKGAGRPILLIHGLYPGANGCLMQPLADALSDSYTVYVIDLPGFGLSDKPKMTYTAYFYVQFLNDFIESVVSAPVSIIADSLSCTFCAIACQLCPQYYTNLLFLNPPSEKEENRIPTRLTRILRTLLELPVLGSLIYNLATTCTRLSARYGHILTKSEIRMSSARAHHEGSHGRYAYASLSARYMNASLSRPLSQIDTSVYIVLSGDPDAAQQQIRYLHKINPSIETEYLRGDKPFLWIQSKENILEICHFLM